MEFNFLAWITPREIRGVKYGKDACTVCSARASCTAYGNGNKMVLYAPKDGADEDGIWLQDDAAPCVVWQKYDRMAGGNALRAWEKERKEGKAGEITLSARWAEYGICGDHRHCELENYRPVTEGQKNALQLASMICEGKAQAAIFVGGNGTGKTHLATCCLKKYGGKYFTEEDLYQKWRVKNDRTGGFIAWCDSLCKLPLIVIDEAGKKTDKDFLQFIFAILDARCSFKKPFVVCSNCKPETLYELYTPSLFSRVSAIGGWVVVDGADERKRRIA